MGIFFAKDIVHFVLVNAGLVILLAIWVFYFHNPKNMNLPPPDDSDESESNL